MRSIIWLTMAAFAAGASVKEAMESQGVVPDLIPVAPEAELKVLFASDARVEQGNELTPTQVKAEPKVTLPTQDPTNQCPFYTIVMMDPDAPSRQTPTLRNVAHWIVGNVPSDAKSDETFAQYDTIFAYQGSGPPKGTGLHRYVLLAYCQHKKLQFDEPRVTAWSRDHRLNFSLKNFTEKHSLGDPIAGNFFVAQYDAWVDERNKIIQEHAKTS